MLFVALSVPGLPAQWYSLPLNSPQQVIAGNWCLAHDTGAGLAVFSAIAQTWTTISPAGSTFAYTRDAVIVTREGPTTLRAWSAFTNSTATQTASATSTFQAINDAAYAMVFDPVVGVNGVLRAYSPYTNTWATRALSQPQSFSVVSGTNVAVQQDGLEYHAYSPYTGQWVTFIAAVAGGNPIVGTDYAAVNLRGTSGPFQYAAFSALRGTWTLSPVYPSTGAQQIGAQNSNALAIKVDSGSPTSFRYAGYSPFTGRWATSTLVHTTGSTQSGAAYGNLVRVQDTDVNARFEVFGAGNGIWQALTGPNLVENSLHEDFHVVTNSVLGSTTVHAASALVGGGYVSTTLPATYPGVTQGSHACVVFGGDDPATSVAYGYSAATNSFAGPIAQPTGSGVSQSSGGAVAGFNVQGSSAYGTHAQAYTARWGTWVAGPPIGPSESWTTSAGTSVLLTYRSFFPGYEFHVFDEHRNTWLPSVTAAPPSFSVGMNCVVYHDAAGNFNAYSSQRGVWSPQSGIGAITNGGGSPTFQENLVWFTTSSQIWVFATPDRTQSWFQWPLSSKFATSGSTPGGSTPFFGVSVRGGPIEYGLLYAALALAPAPVSIPGIGGTLDLSFAGAVQIAALGQFDADGVREVRLSFASLVPPGIQLWLQAVTVDLGTGQIELPGRATGTVFF